MGTFSRWMNGYGSRRKQPADTAFFDERTAEDRKALTWTSPPLTEPMTIVGYPVVHLVMSSTHTDGDVFVYLEEVDANGAAHYVSEGALRASHRKTDPARLAQLRPAVPPLDRGRPSAAHSRRADDARLRSRGHRDRHRRRPSDPHHARRRRPGQLRAVAGHQRQGPADHHRPSRRRAGLLRRAAGGQRRDHVTFKLDSTSATIEERRR